MANAIFQGDGAKRGIVYLVQPGEHIGNNRYKIGMSNVGISRVSHYGSGTRCICIMECQDARYVEAALVERFKQEFVQIVPHREFFDGEENAMLHAFTDVVARMRQQTDPLKLMLASKRMFARESVLCYCGDAVVELPPRPPPNDEEDLSDDDCCDCASCHDERIEELESIKKYFPDFAEDVAFGGSKKFVYLFPDRRSRMTPQGEPTDVYEEGAVLRAAMHSIEAGEAGSDWPSLRTDEINCGNCFDDSTSIGQVEKMLAHGVEFKSAFDLTDKLIKKAHRMKKVAHIEGFNAEALRIAGPTLEDMLARKVDIAGIVETMFFASSHIVDGLYCAFMVDPPAALSDKVLQVAAWDGPENLEDPEQTTGRRIKFKCESVVQVGKMHFWEEYVLTYMPYCLHISGTQYEYENRGYEVVSAAPEPKLSLKNTRREYVYDNDSQNDLPRMAATFRALTEGLTCTEPGPHPETVKLLRLLGVAVR
jgi:hypothetical protein